MIIDFHTHCFPDKIAEKAIRSLSETSGLMPYTDGTIQGLKNLMKKDGVDISVVQSIATNAHQQASVNNFAESVQSAQIMAFGSVYPHAKDAIAELERISAMGLKGVKFHPEYQSFFVDDEIMKPIYQKISQLGLITLFHAGEDYGYMPPYHATPERLKKALKWLDAPVIAAHWGSQGMGQETLKHLCGLDIYFDTAFGYASTPKPIQQAILEKHGTDKILFASDCPWHTPSMDMFQLKTLGLSESEQAAVLGENAKRLLQI